MVANIDSIAYYGEKPWHGLGKEVDSPMTSEEALQMGGLNWSVDLRPVCADLLDSTGQPYTAPIDGYKAVVRTDREQALSIVGSRYTPVQNSEAFSFFDSVVGEGLAQYQVVGALDDGRKVWLLAKLPDNLLILGKDKIEQFLLFANSHDGSGAVRMLFTPVRVVCQNTLRIALGKRADGVAFRHTKSVLAKVQQAKKALGFATSYYDQLGKIAEQMARTELTEVQIKAIVEGMIPSENEVAVATRTQNARDALRGVIDTGIGLGDYQGTAWGVYNGIAEYADHARLVKGENKSEARLTSIWFGSAASFKDRGFELVQKAMAGEIEPGIKPVAVPADLD